jgi:hypothetical protein
MNVRMVFVVVFFSINLNLSAQEAMSSSIVLNLLRSAPSEQFSFNLSMPVLDETGTANWNIKYYVFFQDTLLQRFCDTVNSDQIIPDLLKLLNVETYSWQANLMLYCITKTNAMELQIFSPNRVEEWRENRKDKDLAFWRARL